MERVTALADDDARTTALELLQSVMDLHGAACREQWRSWRTQARRDELAGEAGRRSAAVRLAGAVWVHPVPLKERVSARG